MPQNADNSTALLANVTQMPSRTAAQPSCLMSLEDVAKYLNVSREWVRDHATRRNPRIPVVRLGGKRAVLRFRPQDVEKFITENLVSEGGV
jgi:excisionase family DNA binding protein